MKKSIIAATVLALSFAVPAAFAAEAGGDAGTLTINGLIKGTTCHFDSGAQTAQINMQQIGTTSLQNLNPGQAYTGYSNQTSTAFNVTCDSSTDIPKLKFLADQFNMTGEQSVTKNSGEAQGVGYALFINGQRINSDGSTAIATARNEDGKYTFNISAQYARASSEPVSAGTVDSVVTLTVVAD